MKRGIPAPTAHLRLPPFTDALPAPVFFRTERMPAHATYPVLRHTWGEFVYSFSGVTEVKAGSAHFIAPPHLGLWIAPEVEHTGFNHHEAVHCSVYIRRDLCHGMPDDSCAVMVSPLVRAMLEHLRDLADTPERRAARARLLRVLVDQLSTCRTTGSFVPHSDDEELNRILQLLRDDPADNRTIAELAAVVKLGERTLMRRCQAELGMSLTEWRQRLRFVAALPMLRSGRSVESVAFDLGYASSSAFIAMFRRLTGSSPKRFVA
ncbi:AraC family transcriptional regulator [Burkholderia plantarii]|uniref:AraC family transcriptional regulator n=1 Tax=Burkholderia plantarii TaxID=41899 RepID=UPI0007058B36|nr:helix-turn-helix transcriptional regulator [Burkholderia plantarii]ALK34970.1 AraC family transcriptional regulator [Burkholderia plantarii]GLZ18576.1 AraC family transcriptional regulator [Burkholderia plantarii]